MHVPIFKHGTNERRIQRETPATNALRALTDVSEAAELAGLRVTAQVHTDGEGRSYSVLNVSGADALAAIEAIRDDGHALRGWQPYDGGSVPTWTRDCGTLVLRVVSANAAAA